MAQFLDQRGAEESLTYFDLTTAMALAAFADAPVGRGRGRGRPRRRRRRDQRAAGQHLRDHADRAGPHRVARATRIEEIATAKAGIIHSGATVICAAQPEEAMRADPGALRRGRRHAGPRGRRVRRAPAGRRRRRPGAHRCRASAASTTTSSCRCTARTRRRTRRSRSPPSRRSSAPGASTRQLDPETVREGFAARPRRPAGWSGSARAPTILLDAAHNPHGMTATVTALQRGVRVQPADRGRRRARRQGRRRPCSNCSSRSVDAVVCTRNSSRRGRCRRTSSASSPWRSSARTGCGSSRTCRTPSRRRSTLAETDLDGELAGVGILITGSVVTVADARTLLVR